MPVPLRTRVFSALHRLTDRRPVLQQPADRVRAASDRREQSLGLPLAWLVTGRPTGSVEITDGTCQVADGVDLPLRVYRPRSRSGSPLPVVVNFHGGGFVSGSAKQSEWWCAAVAAAADVVVVSVDYRLAPEHPFPVPAQDCYAATVWTAAHAGDLEVDGTRLAVMGDSAGGNLAAVVSVMARDRGGPDIGLQVLIYPVVDMGADFPSKDENANAPVLNRKDVDAAAALYLRGDDPGEYRDPYASPLFADHAGLPPALIQTAQYDPLRDHGPAYAAALRDAGVAVRLTNYVDAVHGFVSLPGVTVGARQALAEVTEELRRAFTTHQ